MTPWLIIRLVLAFVVVAGLLLVAVRFLLDDRRMWPNGGGGWDPDTYGMSAHRWVGRRAYLNVYQGMEIYRPNVLEPPHPTAVSVSTNLKRGR